MTALADMETVVDGEAAEVACAHCGLPVPGGLVERGSAPQFCCEGCRTVWTVIHTCRMDAYYAHLERDRAAGAAGEAAPAKVTDKRYREFDDAQFLALHAPLREAGAGRGTRTMEFYLEGVHCAACVWLVEKLPAVLPGVMGSRLDLGKRLLRVTWVDGAVQASAIARTLDSLGYPPHPARSSSARGIRLKDDRRQLIRIGVAGACMGNTMLLAVALYAGLFGGMDSAYTLLFRWLSMVIGVVALAWPGAVFFKGAWAAVRTRTPHLDLPIALGLGAGGVMGVWNTVHNTGEIYFDSLSVLVFLLLVGRFLQHRQQGVADDSLELLFSLTPMSAHRVAADGSTAEVAIAALAKGDLVDVLAGESVPVDGRIVPGRSDGSTVDESLLTGESLPKRVGVGTIVFAGTTNVASPVRVEVLCTGEETRVGKLMRLVTQCARRKAPLVLFADRLGGAFLIGVLAVAGLVFGLWKWQGSPAAMDHAVAVLIIACPCALGLATPLAVTVSIGRAAGRGILIKGGDTLERLAKPGLLLLDKTGTLTTGCVTLRSWEGDASARGAVGAIEAHATHPIARALRAALAGECDALSAQEIAQDMRGGIEGVIAGERYLIGSVRYVEEQIGPCAPCWRGAIERVLGRGWTPVVVAREGAVCAVAGTGDAVRPEARQVLEALREAGWGVGILSGDHPMVVAQVAAELGIPQESARGGLLPEQKLEIVRERLRTSHAGRPVVMVGDGVNDAAALAAASVGIAVHGGAEASLAAANVYLNQPGLTPILDLMMAAKKTVRVIWRSLFTSLMYNAFSVSLAALGLINPLVAAILMPISSITVLSLAFSVRTFSREGQVRG